MPDGDFYWKLYCDGERINGGIAISENRAKDAIRNYMRQHEDSQFKKPFRPDSDMGAEMCLQEKDNLPSL